MNTKVKTIIIAIFWLILGASPAFANELANQFTVSLWINPQTSIASKALAVKNTEIRLYTDANGYANCQIYTSDWQTGAVGTAALPLNTWSHVSCTYDKATIKIFVGGIQQNSVAQTAAVNDAATAWRTGSDEGGTYADLTGSIDEVKIYNYARTQKQIVEDMNAGHPAVGSPVGSAVGYWKFDEGYGTTANNSGNGGSTLNGTLTSMASPATSTSGWTNSGKFGKGLVFDGSNDHVTIADNAALDLSTAFTISGWFKRTAAGTHINFCKHVSSGNQRSYCVQVYTDNKIYVTVSSTGISNTAYFTSSSTTTDTNWHLLTGWYNGSILKAYLDGVELPGNVTGTVPSSIYNSTTAFEIGTYNEVNYSSGSIDEVKIYNYALTSDEIKTEYNHGSAMVLGALGTNSSYASDAANQQYCVPGDSTSCAAPVAEWNFDEGSGQSANDTSGNVNTGTWNGTGNHWTSGKYGKAGNFNGSDDRVNATSAITTSNVTVTAWIKTAVSNYSVGGTIVDGLYNSNGPFYFSVNANKPSAWLNGNVTTSFAATTNVSDNNWHFVSLTYDGTTGKIYVDGKPESQTTAVSGNLDSMPSAPKVGYENNNRWYFNGSIDQVRIYNYARTAAQIAWDYNRGGPVGWWKFDECSGNTAHSSNTSYSSSLDGTITIGASGTQTSAGTCSSGTSTEAWNNGASGKFNSSLNFDGTDDQVSLPTTLGTFSVASVTGWFKNSSAGTIISALNGYCGDQIIYSDSNAFGQLCFSNGTYKTVYSGVNTLDNLWHHGVTTFDGTYVRFYLDGRLVGTSGTVTAGVTTHFTENNKIGSYLGSSSYFTGQIDDVRVYNYALTAAQVKTLFNDGAVRFGPSTGNP